MKILVVEDDDAIARTLAEVLNKQHYVVDLATDGQAGWELAEGFPYDLIVLDVMLPKLDGITLCQRLRRARSQVPILMLTAKNSSTDKVMGLDAGADDYVIKPFDVQELLARIRVLLRRGNGSLPPVLEWENLRLNPSSCEVTYENQPLNLTPTEYRLLELFLRNRRRVFSRSAIVEHLWSFDDPPSEDTVTSHIKGLRQKLKSAAAAADCIETVYGLGYRLKERGNKETRAETKAIASQSEVQNQTLAAMAGVWDQFKDSIRDRVDALVRSVSVALEDEGNKDAIAFSQREAHKLGGALGIFGFGEGSRLAREMEDILQTGTISAQSQRLLEVAAALRQELQRDPPQKAPPAAAKPASGAARTVGAPREEPLQSFAESGFVPTVLMIDDDADLAKRIQLEAIARGVHLEVADTPDRARASIGRKPPDAVLLDLSFPDTAETGLTLLQELGRSRSPIPAIVFTARDSFSDRLKAAQLGAIAFLHKPVPAAEVLEAVTRVLQQVRRREAKVLAVGDDEQLLAQLKALLEPWGIKVITLSDPRRFWNVFNEAVPDLLILDAEMAHLSGRDLCQVVRNEPRWGDLPILFLTARADAETVRQLFVAGADDYASKPIIEPELIARIISRLERVRLLPRKN